MLTLISPAKTLDFETQPSTTKSSTPESLKHSKELVDILKQESAAKLSKLMGISPKLAELNVERFKTWKTPFTCENSKQAILAFKGDVYLGLNAEKYSLRDFNFAQKHLRILSGLYGALKPLDLIQPYRLEMGTRLKTRHGKNLYQFWGDRITQCIQCELQSHKNKTLVNLASNEYFKSVNSKLLESPVVTPVFKDYSKGTYKVMSFFAKKARGTMTSYIINNRIDKPDQIKDFDVDGYRFDANYSSDQEWVFTRKGA